MTLPRSSLMAAALSSMGRCAAVSGDEEGMVPEPDGQPSFDDFPDWLLDRLTGRLVDDAKDLLDLHSGRVGERPTRELFGDGIKVIHATVSVGCDDAIADGGEGNLQPVPSLESRAVRLSGGGVVRHLRVLINE